MTRMIARVCRPPALGASAASSLLGAEFRTGEVSCPASEAGRELWMDIESETDAMNKHLLFCRVADGSARPEPGRDVFLEQVVVGEQLAVEHDAEDPERRRRKPSDLGGA